MRGQPAYFPLVGGMDLVTPAVSAKPGSVIAALNYEPTASGYRRLRGFERFNGMPAPSEGAYWVVHFSAGDSDGLAVAVGDTITADDTTLWTGYVAIAPVVTSGSFAGGNAVGYVVVVASSGTLTATDNLKEGSTRWATAVSIVANESVSAATSSAGITAIATALRAQISAVPGSGPVRGVFFEDEVIAVRDNAGATAGIMHRSDAAGWTAVTLTKTFAFNSGGTREMVANDFVEGATSSAQGLVYSIALTSGSWAGGDAAGTMEIVTLTGTFQAENLNVTQSTPTTGVQNDNVTLTDTGTAYALPAGGLYEFVHHNFYGASNLARTYGVNGTGKAFVYDSGTYGGFPIYSLTPISTGMAVDTPDHIAAHKGSLFLSFPGGSLQFSSPGEPTIFDPIVGAGEIGIGCDITALVPTAGALAVLARNSINVLYGTDASDYQLDVLTNEAGAHPYSAQKIGGVIYLDHRGLRSMSTSQAFGNFSMGTLSKMVEPLLRDYVADDVEPVASLVSRASDQYWLFFSNGAGLIVYLGGKQPVILPFDLGKTVTCAASLEIDAQERIFIGCDDGFVYELNKGTSFDGEEIEHYVRLAFNHFGSPQEIKRFFEVSVDVEASGTTTLEASFELDYGSVQGIEATTLSITTGGGAIDDLGSNELYFASQIETQATAHIQGMGKNISMKIGGSTADEEPHTLTGVTYIVMPRG